MKRHSVIALMIMVGVIAVVGVAWAGSYWGTKQGSLVQNLKEVSPDVAKSRCDQVTKTKGTFKTYTTAGWYAVEVDAVDNTGAAVKGRWYLDGKQVGVGSGPFKIGNRGGSDHSSVSFAGYSAPPRIVEFCIRRQ